MKLIPMADKLIVKRHEAKEKTPGGIVLPDRAKEAPRKGEVLAVGRVTNRDARNDASLKPGERYNDVAVGDVIYFTAYSGVEVEENGEKYLILSQDDVLAVCRS